MHSKRLIRLTLLTIVAGLVLASRSYAQQDPLKIYFTWEDTVPPFHIKTINESSNELQYLFFVSGGAILTERNPSFVVPDTGTFQIQVNAFGEGAELITTKTYYLKLSTISNIGDSLSVWIPNSGGGCGSYNNLFLPTIQGSYNNYEFQLFDRWGQLMFYSNDPQVGWDYTFKDQNAPQSVYFYRLRLTDADGKMHEYVGNFTLLR